MKSIAMARRHGARPARLGEGVSTAVGNTPLIELSRLFSAANFRLYAKLEGANPGGSAKDRAAWRMVQAALSRGDIQEGDTVVESSSGNMAVGLAQACLYNRLRFICVTDSRTPPQMIQILHALRAEVFVIREPDPDLGDLLATRLRRVGEIVRNTPRSRWLNQYASPDNPLAHCPTMAEIAEALNGKVDFLFCSVSTCGTIRGCADYIRANELRTTVVAVDANGSAIYGDPRRRRLLPGHGAGMRSTLFAPEMADTYELVSDRDCVIGCRALVEQEAVLAGASSGGVIAAITAYRARIPAGSNVVAILPDRGERYLDTVYSDSWVAANFPDGITPDESSCASATPHTTPVGTASTASPSIDAPRVTECNACCGRGLIRCSCKTVDAANCAPDGNASRADPGSCHGCCRTGWAECDRCEGTGYARQK